MTENFELKYYNNIESKEIKWLWYPYIPYGKITIIQGDPGEGKTTVMLNIIALLSRGETLPFSDKKIEAVSIYQNAEDDNSDTIKPRLEKHNAKCENICFIDKGDGLLFMDDDSIEKAIIKAKAKLLVLDPIQAYIGDCVDMNRANVIRPRMAKLKETAEKTGCAIVLIGHMNKNSGGKANYRGLGSIDILAAARSVLVVGKMNKISNIKVFAQLKNNLAPIGKSISFKLSNGVINWISEVELTAEDILSGSPLGSKLLQAEEFLQTELENGARPAKELIEEAEIQGISERTLNTAKANLHIKSVKRNGCWFWKMQKSQRCN